MPMYNAGHVFLVVRQVAIERAHRFAALAERRVHQRQRLRESLVGRPLGHRFLENHARLPEIADAHERVAQPLVDLGEIAAVDERGLPGARRLEVVAGCREGRRQIGEDRAAVTVAVAPPT